MSNERFTVEEQAHDSRYVLRDSENGAEIGQIRYVDVAGAGAAGAADRVMVSTEVSEDYAGQGLAAELTQAAVEDAVSQSMKIVPVCPYVTKWFEKNPAYEVHAITARPEHLRAIS